MDGTNAKAAFTCEFGQLIDSGNQVARSILYDLNTSESNFIQLADPTNPRDHFDTGRFRMGAPAEEDPEWDEFAVKDSSQHWAELSPFVIQRYCVTNEQYELFDPAHKHRRSFETPEREVDQHPVVNVNWFDAWCFAIWVGVVQLADRKIEIKLPTESQCEYACRCGETTPFTWPDRKNGNQILSGDANF